MWAAKLPGEAAAMWDACEALRDIMLALGVIITVERLSFNGGSRTSTGCR